MRRHGFPQRVWTTKHLMQKEKQCGHIRRRVRPGSTRPRATTESKPAGAFFSEQLSLVMVCSLPRATSHRNITPVALEVLTEDKTRSRATITQHLPPRVFSIPSRLTVTRRLAVFRGEVNAAADTASRMRHDPQATLQDGRHHRDVRSVPQQTAVLQALVLAEALPLRDAATVSEGQLQAHQTNLTVDFRYLRLSVHFPHVANLRLIVGICSHFQVRLDHLEKSLAVTDLFGGPRALQSIAQYLESLCFGVHETQVALEGGVVLVQRVRNCLHLFLGLLCLRLESLGQLNVSQNLHRAGRTTSDQLHTKVVG